VLKMREGPSPTGGQNLKGPKGEPSQVITIIDPATKEVVGTLDYYPESVTPEYPSA